MQGLLVLRQDFVLEDAIGSQACSLEANMRAMNANLHILAITSKF